jgi:predicted 3-demethylubiquinone-9 3-methyltransferase (glyoxalase superfamily)
MPNRVSTFLMFDGAAEEAMNLYVDLFQGSVASVERWGPGEPGQEGSFKLASFSLAGHDLRCFDSPTKHDFTFTPAVSLFVECASEAELEAAYARFSEGGQVFMPLADYGFSKRFGWISDRFGVSWQLNLA